MSREQIKEEFLKSYNCSSMKEFKHTKLTSEKFYEIMEDYFTKCSYNQKYEEVIDKAIEYIESNPLVIIGDYDYFVNDLLQMEENCKKMSFVGTLLDILKEVI